MPRISSAAFPNVAFRTLPAVGPIRSAKPSVASPSAFASGISEAQATKNTSASLAANLCRSQAAGKSSHPARHSHREITAAPYTASKRMRPSRSLRATRRCASSTSRLPITSDSVR